MNWDQFKKSLGARFRFEPPAVILDEVGNELPEAHDDWLLQSIADGRATLQNERTQHIVELAKDNIKEFGSDANRTPRGGPIHGFLVLKVQVFIQGTRVNVRGTPRPGEQVPRARRVKPEWTPWLRVQSHGFPADTTKAVSLQYRLWCDDPAVPLMIRFASTAEGRFQQEFSGPSGVITQLIVESETYYVSVSHPRVQFEVGVTGFRLDR